MKTFCNFSLFALILFFCACDKVQHPIVPVEVTPEDTSGFIRKILLEDYTGQDCPNCPRAAREAEKLIDQYGDRLIVVAVHGGVFAMPYGEFTNDFRTPAGNAYLKEFSISGWPAGMINRKKYSGTSFASSDPSWASYVSLASKEPYILGLQPTVTYNATTRILNAEVKGTFRKAYSSNVQVCAMLVEDSIVGLQNDNGTKFHDYEFEHLFRGTIAGTDIWGKRLKTAPIAAKADSVTTFSNFSVLTKHNDKHLSVVFYAYDQATKEVLQVEKVKVVSN